MRFQLILLVMVAVLFTSRAVRAQAERQTEPAASPKPTLWLVGDSTVNNHANGGLGWGTPIAEFLNAEKVNVINSARGGRSARSYDSEGLWKKVLDQLKPGDFVLIQFGHNDGPGTEQQIADSSNGRPDLAGTGDDTTTGPDSSPQHQNEIVHTYGWYLRKYVQEAKAKGATPILLTMVPKNFWTEDKKIRRPEQNTLVKWAHEVATGERIPYIDLNSISAKRLEQESPEEVRSKYFNPPNDGTHTNPAGAKFNAESVVMGLRALPDIKLNDLLSDAGKALPPAAKADVEMPEVETK